MRSWIVAGLLVLLGGCSRDVRTSTIQLPDGQRIFVRSIGTGPDTVLVLHHGPGLHGGYLVPMLARQSVHHTFLVYDQRGRGRSDASLDTTKLSLAQDLADLDAVRTYFRLERPAILGHGWGALLAAHYALDHPEHVRRLLMVGPLFPRAAHVWGAIVYPYEFADSLALVGLDSARLARLDSRDARAFCRRYWGAWLSPAAVRDQATINALRGPMCAAPEAALARVEAVNRAVLRTVGNWDLRPRLHELSVPMLLIQGLGTSKPDSSVAVVWRTAAREWTESAQGSAVVFLPGAAQFPWVAQQEAFDRVVDIFLAGGFPPEARAPHSRLASQ